MCESVGALGHAAIQLDGANAFVTVGGVGNEGDLLITDTNGSRRSGYTGMAARSTSAAGATRINDRAAERCGVNGANQVIRLVKGLYAELAVVGLRNRSATFELILGSHARQVVVNAPCPVVVLKQQLTAA